MDGIINLLKPPGISSNGAVTAVRKLTGVKKAGHTGTLDPGAAGVLAVCLGKATKLSEFLMDGKKEYIAEIAFGTKTDTQDSYGQVTAVLNVQVAEEDLLRVLPRFTGGIIQATPAYSAAKQNGRPLYKLARQGLDITPKQRNVTIDQIELIGSTGANRFTLRISCGKGTYIRTLCEDIGAALNVPAYMSLLIRTGTSGFTIGESVTLDELEKMAADGTLDRAVMPVDGALSRFERLELPEALRLRLLNGNEVADTALQGKADGAYRVYCGGFLGLGMLKQGIVKITTLLTGVS